MLHLVGQLDDQAQAPKGVFPLKLQPYTFTPDVFHCPLAKPPCYCCQRCPWREKGPVLCLCVWLLPSSKALSWHKHVEGSAGSSPCLRAT